MASNIFFELLRVKRNGFHVEQYSNLKNLANWRWRNSAQKGMCQNPVLPRSALS